MLYNYNTPEKKLIQFCDFCHPKVFCYGKCVGRPQVQKTVSETE